jgi:hypothetical protein
VSAQIVALGGVQIINCTLTYTAVGLGSKIVLRTRPKMARRVGQFSGLAMIVITSILIVEQIVKI